MIEVWVQLGLSAEKYISFHIFGTGERILCQRLSNRFQSEVRAIRGNHLVARFIPHKEVR